MNVLVCVMTAEAAPLIRGLEPADVLREVASELADDPAELRPSLDGWLAAGGDAESARSLLLSGGRRGCTGRCAPALLDTARDGLVRGLPPEAAVRLVLEAQHDLAWRRMAADRPATDAEAGDELRRAVAERLVPAAS